MNGIRLYVAWLALMVAGGISAAAVFAAAPQRPNIVLLISDDDDYEHFGFMGNKRVHTPTLDRLAAAGTVFTNAHVPAPLCRPSLASILSGRLPHQHGIYANYLERQGIGNDPTKLDPTGSLANRLKAAGYATYATAKYWEGDPRAMGFTHGTVNVTFKGFGSLIRQGQDELFKFIDEQHEKKPMFIWFAPLVPHTPHNPPPKYAERFANTGVPIPPYYKGKKKPFVDAMRKFYAMGTWFDDGVAQLIQKLREVGEFENTLFLFYVDNGWTLGMPAKSSPYEKGLRTPMFVTGPGRVPAGKRIEGLTYALDLHATILDYAGIKPPNDIASETLRPLIEGKTEKTHDALYGAVFAHAPVFYSGDPSVPRSPQRDVFALHVRTKRWKYVLYTQDIGKKNERYIWIVHRLSEMPERRKGEENLFDLDADPYEMNNLAGRPEHKQRVAEFRKQVLDWWRRTGGEPIAGITAIAAEAPAPPPLAAEADDPPPNFIVVFTDDQGYGDLGCFGSKNIKTPHIDRLAAEGMKLTSFYVTCGVCSPSRASLMTGCYYKRVSVNKVLFPAEPTGLHPDEDTIADVLKRRGYATACVGKWHLGDQPAFLPTRQGFDEYFGLPYSNDMHLPNKQRKYTPLPLLNGEKVIETEPDQDYLTKRYTEYAVDFIARHKDQPFFLYLPHSMPHRPIHVSTEFMERASPEQKADLDVEYKRSRDKLYPLCVEEIDWSVGRIVDALKKRGLEKRTFVLFTSDNGPAAGSAGPLRGGKGSTWEGGMREPTVAWWPGKIPAGVVCDKVASTIDVLPTLAKLAGADLPRRKIDGKNIWPLLSGEPGARSPHEAYFYYRGPTLQAVRSGPWKLHRPGRKKGGKVRRPALFNLESDITESKNVAARHPDVVKRLAGYVERLEKELGRGGAAGPGVRPPGRVEDPKPLAPHPTIGAR